MKEQSLPEDFLADQGEMTGSNTGHAVRVLMGIGLGIVLAGLVFVGGFLLGAGLDEPLEQTASPQSLPLLSAPGANAQTPEDVDFGVFWEVWNTVESDFYYDLPSSEDRVYGAINGLLESLDDPYTAFIEPDAASILREDDTGTFEGIGAYVEEAPEGGVYIIRVFEGAPAEDAGLLAGDIVIAVDGEDVTGNILNESLLLIRGEAGTPVMLTVVREGVNEPFDITIYRGRIEIPTVESEMLEGNIGYVALFEFNSVSADRLQAAIEDLLDQGADSLILDLRNNPGGFLDESIKIADMFLPEGLVLIQRDVDGNVREHESRDGDLAEDVPLVVLVNQNSASASEIVAGAIQDNARGTLIGETSFGKGSVQLLYDLSDGSQLRVTYANWFTPNDNTISGEGITPDIIVEVPVEPGPTDIQLERAIEFLQTGQ